METMTCVDELLETSFKKIYNYDKEILDLEIKRAKAIKLESELSEISVDEFEQRYKNYIKEKGISK